MEKRTQDTSHTCSTCGKRFTDEYDLKVHLKIHTGDHPHSCSVCQKTYHNRYSLARHRRIHRYEYPLICTVYDKSFKDNKSLTNHCTMLHTNKRFFNCYVCHKSFSKRKHLFAHIKTDHKQYVPKSLFNEGVCSKETSLPSAVDQRTEDKSSPVSSSTNLPDLHSSDVPYIINVKVEDDI